MGEPIIVNIGDMKWAQGDHELITYALGSCVGISFYDPVLQLGGLLHILLPVRPTAQDRNLMKYADSGIHASLQELARHGFRKERAIVKIAGGAGMFAAGGMGTGFQHIAHIGERNAASVKETLQKEGLAISAEDLGGTIARTMALDVKTGVVSVRTIGKKEKQL